MTQAENHNQENHSNIRGKRGGKGCAPGEIRTPDPLLRRQMLYPPELQALRIRMPRWAIGEVGFEPTTSCSQGKRANQAAPLPAKAFGNTREKGPCACLKAR
jgi:hypothetical protein